MSSRLPKGVPVRQNVDNDISTGGGIKMAVTGFVHFLEMRQERKTNVWPFPWKL
jgi:hypothetical protein